MPETSTAAVPPTALFPLDLTISTCKPRVQYLTKNPFLKNLLYPTLTIRQHLRQTHLQVAMCPNRPGRLKTLKSKFFARPTILNNNFSMEINVNEDTRLEHNSTTIKWLDKIHSSDYICPVCLQSNSTSLLDVKGPLGRLLHLRACEDCDTAYYADSNPVVGYESYDNNDFYWKHYAQIGAGISSMLQSLLSVSTGIGASLLEVGSGFGYMLDFWKKIIAGPAIGLETASYGKIGASILNTEIYPEYLRNCSAIKGKKFDIVYSSEVIEHVRNPREFIAELKSVLHPTGHLILTTPAREYLDKSRDESELLASLAPGFHYFILSKKALLEILLAEGFANVKITQEREKFIAVATNSSNNCVDFYRPISDVYLHYLSTLSKVENTDVKGGALYRLFKESVNSGRYDAAEHWLTELESFTISEYNICIEDPPVKQALALSSAEEYIRQFPAWLGCIQYYLGIYYANHADDQHMSLRCLEAATRLLRHEVRNWGAFSQESSSLIESADFHFRRSASFILRRELPFQLGISTVYGEATPSDTWVNRMRSEVIELTDDLHRYIKIIS